MRKSNNFKNQNTKVSQKNELIQIAARRKFEANRKNIVYASIACIETNIRKFAEKHQDFLLPEQEKKLNRLHRYALGFIDKFLGEYEITESGVKTGGEIYLGSLKRLKEQYKNISLGLDTSYEAFRDVEALYLEIGIGFKLIEDIMKPLKNEKLDKYLYSFKIQVQGVKNFIKKEADYDPTSYLKSNRKTFKGVKKLILLKELGINLNAL